MPLINGQSTIFFATFSRYENGKRLPTNGMVEPVLSYFLPKVSRLILLDSPHLVSDTIDPIIEVYKSKKQVDRYVLPFWVYLPIYLLCRIPNNKETRISYKLRDFFSVFWVAMTSRGTFELFIGLESIYGLAGIILRSLGKVKRVVYYVSDYAPNRFKNPFFNSIYLMLDRFCVRFADATWDVSPAMIEGRFQAGLARNKKYKVIHVPNGLFPSQIKPLPIWKRDPNRLIYMGILQKDMGPDMAIRSLLYIQKKFPKISLHIVGGVKRDVREHRKLASQLKLADAVVFHGFVQSNSDMANIVRRAYIGLAPYRDLPDSLRFWGDAGKIRQYTASGLPVVTTHVPPLGRYIVSRGAGILTDDTESGFANGIVRILENKKLYSRLSKRAELVSADNTWDKIYSKALKQMEELK